jgi:hypothetical protein
LRRPVPDAPKIPVNPSPESDLGSTANFDARISFYQDAVDPRIKSATEANEAAAKRCIERIENKIEGYRAGVDPFVADINSWGTRLRVVKQLGNDWWYEENDSAAFVGTKVSKHLFDDARIQEDISTALQQFREDVQANENTMLIQIRAAVTASGHVSIPEQNFNNFAKLMNEKLKHYANSMAVDSLQRAVLTEVVSGVGGAAATQVVRMIAVEVATMLASTATSAGGATAVTTVAGGAGGTTVGPWGTAAGVVGGLVIGLAIDWWISESYAAELSAKLNETIDQVKLGAVQGVDGEDGLKVTLDEACAQLQRSYEETLYQQIVTGGQQ